MKLSEECYLHNKGIANCCQMCDAIGKEYKPMLIGNPEGNRYFCSNCDFPENETLVIEEKYCFNCGCKLDWSDWK